MSIPDQMLCPITRGLMRDPVVGPDGYSYERKSLAQALKRKAQSPMTRQSMKINQCHLNRALKETIRKFLASHPELASERPALTWKEIKAGDFDEFDTFEPASRTKEEWFELMETPKLFKRMKITDYDQKFFGKCTLIYLASIYNLEDLVRWLAPRSSLTRIKLSSGSYVSPLTRAIQWKNLPLIRFLLVQEIALLQPIELIYMIQLLSPYQLLDLLTPYQAHLKKFNSKLRGLIPHGNQKDSVLCGSLMATIARYVQNEASLHFFLDLLQVGDPTLVLVSLLRRIQADSTQSVLLLSTGLTQLISKGKMLRKSELVNVTRLPTLSPETQAAWNYHLQRLGWEKMLVDSGWIKLPDSES